MLWEAIFLLLILKIPVVYLASVVWWAVRSEPAPPEPLEPSLVTAPIEPDGKPGWRFRGRTARPNRPRGGPHGSPQRLHRRAPVPAGWQAAGWRGPEGG